MRVLSREAEDTEAGGHGGPSESARSKDPAAQWKVAIAVGGVVDEVDVSRELLPMQQTPRAFGTGLRQRSSCGSATNTR
jgi:hypothetical protein